MESITIFLNIVILSKYYNLFPAYQDALLLFIVILSVINNFTVFNYTHPITLFFMLLYLIKSQQIDTPVSIFKRKKTFPPASRATIESCLPRYELAAKVA